MPESEPPYAGAPTLAERLGAQLGRKLATWIGLAVGICVPYFALQQLQLFPVRAVPRLALDDAIAFAPAWVPVYLSIAALVAVAPMLATRRDELDRYAAGLALLCAACFAVFLLAPVEGPRPPTAARAGLYGWLISVDRATNSMPSLHAGLVVYSLAFAHRVLAGTLGRAGRHGLETASVLWGGAILYSTLATKQHWVLDLPAGAALAIAAHATVWHRRVRPRGG